MSRRPILPRFARHERGATAAEFALILPALLFLTLGVINISLMLFATASLHYAAEDAARWCMINSCADVSTYAAARYTGPAMSPVFTLTHPACGELVSASATFNLVTGLSNLSVPISAAACHPLS
jgi:Flp pilus assembly pilin Flp